MKILITGFAPFPGASFNPTELLVHRLARLRRPALDIERKSHVFPVTYDAVDRELPELVTAFRPDALLMFGLATRSPHLRIETRARNAITTLWPDTGHARIKRGLIELGGPPALPFGPHTRLLLRAARQTGVPAALSHDAGRYLCNYLSWRALEQVNTAPVERPAPRLAVFIHVPLVPRPAQQRRRSSMSRLDLDDLVRAGEAVLLTLVRLARTARIS